MHLWLLSAARTTQRALEQINSSLSLPEPLQSESCSSKKSKTKKDPSLLLDNYVCDESSNGTNVIMSFYYCYLQFYFCKPSVGTSQFSWVSSPLSSARRHELLCRLFICQVYGVYEEE